AYSVMDQDKLNHVLTAKPHERRVFIEEAAGIARYKQQRNETQGKLDAARQNLVRVRDVMDEVRRQLGSLERQARKAQQYKAQQREVLQASEHRLGDLRQSVQKIQGELERLLERREQMGVQLQELSDEALRLDEEVRATTERLAAIVGERATAREALAEAERV